MNVIKRAQVEVIKYKCMARSFWERWQWELQQCKKCLLDRSRQRDANIQPEITTLKIDPKQLCLPPNIQSEEESYIGRGSFGVVKVNFYRGISVAVKVFLPKTEVYDIRHEASILARFSHPFVPYLFGIC